jgi:hypothetical protein
VAASNSCIRSLFLLYVSTIVLGVAPGCGRSPTVPLAGEITLDGAALPTGAIVLMPLDGKAGPSVGCGIVEGRYSIPAERGPLRGAKYRVEIRSIDPDSASKTDPRAVFRDRVPAAYNSQSQLELTIPADCSSVQKDFPLQTQQHLPSR